MTVEKLASRYSEESFRSDVFLAESEMTGRARKLK